VYELGVIYLKLCTIKDCNKKHHARGYCSKHYHEFYIQPLCKTIKCSVEGCNNWISSSWTKLKLCDMHGTRLKRNGSVKLKQRERNIKSLVNSLLTDTFPLDFELINNNSFSDIGRLYYGNKCTECGWDIGQCQAHHKIPKKQGGKSTLRNCMILCPNCHSLKHIRRRQRYSDELNNQLTEAIKKHKNKLL